MALKLWIYDYIKQQEQADPDFERLMTKLSYSTSPLQGAPSNPTGVPLWEAIFFGNFNPSYETTIIDAYGNRARGAT